MNSIDLHTHSSCSDGSFSPRDLIILAKNSGLNAIALTDHDTIDGFAEASEAAKEYPVELIYGIELAAGYQDTEIHILGLLIQPQTKILSKQLIYLKKSRHERNLAMLTRFNELEIPLSYEDLVNARNKTVVTRGHFAHALRQKGYVRSISEAFEKYLSPGCDAYIPRQTLSPQTCIDLILSSGGIPTLAHPLLYKMERSSMESLIKNLSEKGLKGLECYYSMNQSGDDQYLLKLAKKYRLLPTGGSDFHGENKPHIQLGSGRGNLWIPPNVLSDLKEAAKLLCPLQ